jgi:hypothetical protein
VGQLEANAAAADLDLSDEEDRMLTEASDRFLPRTGPGTFPALARARVQQRSKH